jgi:hypothetical protein
MDATPKDTESRRLRMRGLNLNLMFSVGSVISVLP